MKRLLFVGTTREDLREFPDEPRTVAGYELFRVQQGLEPSDWKPMSAVGHGAVEIRIHVGGAWRVVYVAKFEEGVYVLHAFEKRTQRTSRRDIELARRRYEEIGK